MKTIDIFLLILLLICVTGEARLFFKYNKKIHLFFSIMFLLFFAFNLFKILH